MKSLKLPKFLTLSGLRGFTRLDKEELADVLRFIGEDPESVFFDISAPTQQTAGWSSAITGGRYRVKTMPDASVYDVRVDYTSWHSLDGTKPELEREAALWGQNFIEEKRSKRFSKRFDYQVE